MDAAKAMVYFSGEPIPLAAIPTTSGSGAEVTDFAIVTHNEVKHPLVSERLRPQIAILDSELLEELPRSLIADAGFDVLAHALEAVAGRNASPITDALARDAFCTAYSLLPASYGGGALGAAAHSPGCHHGGHGLSPGGTRDLPRLSPQPGWAISRTSWTAQRHFIARRGGLQRCGSRCSLHRLGAAGRPGGSAEAIALRNLKNGLIRLRRELRLPATLAEAGVAPRTLQRNLGTIVEAALADPCCKTNPVEPSRGLLEELLKEVAGHG